MDIPTSAEDLFDDLVPASLRRFPDRARAIDTILCFKIVGCGDWTIDCSRGVAEPTCVRGASDAAKCTIEVALADFQAMLATPEVGTQLYAQKKLRLSGDPAHAVKIAPLFVLCRPQ